MPASFLLYVDKANPPATDKKKYDENLLIGKEMKENPIVAAAESNT